MKSFFLLLLLSTLLVSASDCSKKKDQVTYRGRLEIKGICMNYTIGVIGGTIDTSLVASAWTDENTGKSYTNVFKLGSPCNFPAEINVGDEFDFVIDTTKPEKNCMVCMAYYPVPPRSLAIKVVK
jgi:hypothetical protein